MAIANKAKVKHNSSQSSKKSYKTEYIRRLNFMYGELVFDFKLKKTPRENIKIITDISQLNLDINQNEQ